MKRFMRASLVAKMAALVVLCAVGAGLFGGTSRPSNAQEPPRGIDSTSILSQLELAEKHPVKGPMSCTGTDRLVTVTNSSGKTIWVAAVGTTDTASPDPATCSTNSQCSANEFCDTVVSQCRSVPINGTVSFEPSSPTCTTNSDCTATGFAICYTGAGQCGSMPQTGNGFQLANAASQNICVPTTWGGRIWARTGCKFSENSNTTCAGSCQGQTVTAGASCATTSDCQKACVGGTNNGLACTTNSNCPGVCAGGTNNGQSCMTGADCPSASMNPGTCNFGTCGKAFCQAGTACCSTGSCTGPQLTCSGGANAGNDCTTASDCPTACAGGMDNGHQCASASDCPGVCNDGPNSGETCKTNSDCGATFICNTGSCTNSGVCGANTFSLYCADSGSAPATLAELTLAPPGVCVGGSGAGGVCGSACTTGGGTCNTSAVPAKSDFFDIQAGIDGPNLPAVITPTSGSYQITADLLGVDVNTTACQAASDCSGGAPYSQCFSPESNPKIFGPKEGVCARSCASSKDCTTKPYTKCFKSPSPFENLSTGICIQPCTSNSQCAGITPANPAYPMCDVKDGACIDPYECTSPGCSGGSCATAGPPGGPYLASCNWNILTQANCPANLRILDKNNKFVGCASACTQCQPGAAQPASLNCGASTTIPWATTNTDLYCCDNGSISCFDSKANPTASNCCGYTRWGHCVHGTTPGAFCGTNFDCKGKGICTGAPLPQGQATPSFIPATGTGTWLGVAEPITKQFKASCPTAYSYQYDDSTSTFVCGGVSSTNNTGYTVTFMPR